MQIRRAGQRAGRIVRVRNKDHARARSDGGEHRSQVVGKFAGRRLDARSTRVLDLQRVDRKRMLRIHGFARRRQKRARGRVEHVVGAVAEHDLRHLDTVAFT